VSRWGEAYPLSICQPKEYGFRDPEFDQNADYVFENVRSQ
jgi:hypothetical protein